VGDTTKVAARFLAGADPGRIAISEATHRLAGGYFYSRSLGALPMKGKAERRLTPFVGRDRELQSLFECFEKARAGHGQVVFVVGEPGIGKSRLLLEFRRHLGEDATWLEGRSIAFYPLIDMLRRNFRVEEGDTEGTIATKIERGVIRLGEDLRSALPYLRYLLSVDPGDPVVLSMDPRQRRGETFDALQRLTIRASEVRPQVVERAASPWRSRNSIRTGWPSSTRSSPTTSRKVKSGSKALEYLLKAEEKAAQAFANREAVVLYDKGLEAAGQVGDAVDVKTLVTMCQPKANIYFVLRDYECSRSESERFLSLARQTGDRVNEGTALAEMGL
jgi:hypothetical protein